MNENPENRCRLCGSRLPSKDFLTYRNMPKSAQFFPDKDTVSEEKGVDIILKQCPCCGLVQAVGEPVSYYRDVIRATGVSKEMTEFRRKQYAEWVRENRLEGKKVIEIGCGKGEYMNMMETTGAEVFGLEHLNESVVYARQQGHRVIEGFIEDEDSVIGSYGEDAQDSDGDYDEAVRNNRLYDGFYIMNFLEHIPEPSSFLKGIANNLTDDGVGIVEVPNFDMMLQKSLYSEFIQDHLSYFTEGTLCNLLSISGFEVIKCESIWYDYIISAKVRKRKGFDVQPFLDMQEKVKSEVHSYVDEQKAKGHKLAVWGAGHQALANLSQLELEKDIEFVVDSADFKQNKFTPATHIPIVAPDRLKDGEVQAVIIMGGGYSVEIKGIVERDYPGIEAVVLSEDGLEK
ncbi:class I SAM-dependent methyltransferase [Butyrivibrio sp. VCD2006]|uniref:class I SAM-dependent methyltransferase n=1 Tax=Butyrivibrio sp. VCD2006 TaxID=1280664 RepID=UPI0003FB134B|nr:class I SAM-dependent methyltransferase [Butyrivibrio sp. VCD2006]